MDHWEYKEPTNLELAVFVSTYSVQHPQLRYSKTTPVIIERTIAEDPIYRQIALYIHRKFCDEMGREIEKMMAGELPCGYVYGSGMRCVYFNRPGSYLCPIHQGK